MTPKSTDVSPVKGLVPAWSKEAKWGRLINARAETVTRKPSFRGAAAKRRCVLPADGYYEWRASPDGKRPCFLHDDKVLNMAGLYELRRDPAKDNNDPTRWDSVPAPVLNPYPVSKAVNNVRNNRSC